MLGKETGNICKGPRAVPVAQAYLYSLHEGHILLWVSREGKDSEWCWRTFFRAPGVLLLLCLLGVIAQEHRPKKPL